MILVVPLETVRAEWAKKYDSLDTKHVEIWHYQGKRIDIIQPWTPV
jgi:hypothetical protein